MPTYVCLFDWTDQGIRNARDSVERVERSTELAQEKYGVTMGQIYWTVGPYDLVGVLERARRRRKCSQRHATSVRS
jgi:uncharacterized protein with GYD domain